MSGFFTVKWPCHSRKKIYSLVVSCDKVQQTFVWCVWLLKKTSKQTNKEYRKKWWIESMASFTTANSSGVEGRRRHSFPKLQNLWLATDYKNLGDQSPLICNGRDEQLAKDFSLIATAGSCFQVVNKLPYVVPFCCNLLALKPLGFLYWKWKICDRIFKKALHILQNVYTTITKVVLLGHLWMIAFYDFFGKLSRLGVLFPYFPLNLKVISKIHHTPLSYTTQRIEH